MEKMPFQPELQKAATMIVTTTAPTATATTTATNWRQALPVMAGRTSRSASCARTTRPRCWRCSRPKKYRGSSRRRRPRSKASSASSRGRNVSAWPAATRASPSCPRAWTRRSASSRCARSSRASARRSGASQWHRSIWGSGIFVEGARLILDFAFDVIGASRLEARAATANGRGNGALRKLGAVQEGVLRRSFFRNGHYLDQVLWGILAEDWRMQRIVQAPAVAH